MFMQFMLGCHSDKRTRFSLLVLALSLAGVTLILAACSSLSTVNHFVALNSQKKALLDERLNKFTKSLYWGAFGEMALYVDPETRSEIFREIKKRRKAEKLVELEIENVEYDEGVGTAYVDFQIRYYKKPANIIKLRKERQVWKYHRFDGGWFLHESETVATNISPEPEVPSIGRGSLQYGNN